MKLARRVRTTALIAGLLTLSGLAGGGAAHAARGLEIALQDEPVFLQQSYFNRERALAMARSAQVTRIRVNVQWVKVLRADANRTTVPANPKYDFAAYDSLIDAAARYGIRVEMSLTGQAPAFATGNGRSGPFRPNARLYADFVRAAATHFKGRVDRYFIYNEPNYVGWISPLKSGPSIYRALFQAGYPAIKSVDPTAQVLIGVTSPYALPRRATAPLKFLRGVTCVNKRYRRVGGCTPLVADGYAHHPYDFTRPIGPPNRTYPARECLKLSRKLQRRKCPDGKDAATLGTISRLTRALTRLARNKALAGPTGRPLDIYLTEYGYFAIGQRRIPEARRAKYLVQAFKLAARNPRIKQLLQYGLIKPPSGFVGSFFDLSIVGLSGAPQKSYTSLRNWATGAANTGQVKKPVPYTPPPTPPPTP